MGHAIDHQTARSTDPFAAVVIKGDRDLPPLHQPLVEDIEHLEEGHIGTDPGGLVLD
jgi:hypothetical protein